MQVAGKHVANHDTVTAVAKTRSGLKGKCRQQACAVANHSRIVKFVPAQLGSTGQEGIVTVDTCFHVAVRLGMASLFNRDGQHADHRVALAAIDKIGR
jgi:hypothetical protein